jgi:hypothetical protein
MQAGAMGSRVELRRDNGKGNLIHVKTDVNVAVDVADEDECLELLKRMAKRHGLKPTECQLTVKTGRKWEHFRL